MYCPLRQKMQLLRDKSLHVARDVKRDICGTNKRVSLQQLRDPEAYQILEILSRPVELRQELLRLGCCSRCRATQISERIVDCCRALSCHLVSFISFVNCA